MTKKKSSTNLITTPRKLYNDIEIFRRIAENKNGKCLSDKYESSVTKLHYECENGHQFYALPSNTLKGNWCRICSNKKKGENRRTSIEWFKQYAISKGGLCLSEDYTNQKSRLKF